MSRPARVAVCAACATCVVLVGGCGSDRETTGTVLRPTVETTTPADGSKVVRYELSGTAVNFDGTFSEPHEGAEKIVQLHETALPWSKDLTVPPTQALFVAGLVAEGPNLESTVTCKIIDNGTVVAQETGPSVDCRAEVTTGG